MSRTDDRIGSRRLTVDPRTGTLSCHYEWCRSEVGRASDQRDIAIEIGDGGVVLSLWDRGLVRRVATIDALSAFLLAPILGAT